MLPRKYSVIVPLVIQRKTSITDIPTEILHLILTYFTDNFRGIIKFSTISKCFKDIGDHSPQWLTFELSFYAPTSYFRLKHPQTPALTELKETNGNNSPLSLYIRDPIDYFPSNKFKVCVSRAINTKSKHQELQRATTTSIDLEENGEADRNLKPTELALQIRNNFLDIFVKFHRQWNWYVRWLPWLDGWSDRIKIFKKNFYLSFCFWLGIIAQLLACYLLSDLPNANTDNQQLSLSNHFGFVCIYVWIVAYQMYFLLDVVRTVYSEFKDPRDQNMLSSFSWIPLFPIFGAELYFTGWLGSIILLHIKLAYSSTSQLLFSHVSIPMWLCFGIAFSLGMLACRYSQPQPNRIETLSMLSLGLCTFAFPLAFTLIGLYYDQSSNSHPLIKSLAEAIIPLYPIQFPLVLIVLWSIYDNLLSYYKIYQRIFVSYRDQSPFIKLGIDIIRTILFTGMLHIVLYFDFMMIYNDSQHNKLSVAMILGIVFELCIYIIVYGVIYS